MRPNGLCFLAGVLLAAAVGVGVWMYQDSRRDSVEISIGGSGVRIERR